MDNNKIQYVNEERYHSYAIHVNSHNGINIGGGFGPYFDCFGFRLLIRDNKLMLLLIL